MNKYHIRAKKSLGQNFLTDKSIVKRIIKAADLKKNDAVLEIGPGLGVLTKELAIAAKEVVAIEKDKKLCDILRQELKDYDNVKIINADILSFRFQVSSFKIVANLPFNIASAIIRKFLENPPIPKEMVLMVQKEVAQRIAAKPPKMSILTVSVQIYAEAKIISYISKNSFYPKPKVDAAILKIVPHVKPGLTQKDLFFKIVKAGFSSPRKQLINNLSKGLQLEKESMAKLLEQNKIDPTRRAQTLTIQDWKNLTKSYKLFTTN
jgi:16S rRNA (adenine1518-N6/adenine1519-N6)-dimethyltransferase